MRLRERNSTPRLLRRWIVRKLGSVSISLSLYLGKHNLGVSSDDFKGSSIMKCKTHRSQIYSGFSRSPTTFRTILKGRKRAKHDDYLGKTLKRKRWKNMALCRFPGVFQQFSCLLRRFEIWRVRGGINTISTETAY